MSKQEAVKRLKALKCDSSQGDVDEIIVLVEAIVEGGAYAPSCPKNFIVSGEQDNEPIRYVVLARNEEEATRTVRGLGVKVAASKPATGPVQIS
jgi:hypothetical protein